MNLFYAGGIALLGWLGKTLWDAVAKLKEELNAVKVDLPKTYATKDDIASRFDKIDESLNRIFDKLDKKADKQGAAAGGAL